jgi:AraC-like DNA-binding protein
MPSVGEVLPVAAFDTAGLPPQARYDAWRTLISAVFEPSPAPGEDVRDMRAQARSVHFGQALLVEAASQSQHFTRSRRLVAVEGLDHYMIQVYRRGSCEGAYGEVQNSVRPGDIKVIDLAQPFHSLNSDFENITLTIPRAALAPLLARPDRMHGRVLPREDPMARVIGAHIHVLSDTAADMSPTQAAGVAAGTVRLMAACLGAHPRARDETHPYRAAAVGQSVRAFVDQSIASPLLNANTLAQRFRVSRRQMYRLFAGDGGVEAYIQARRLQRSMQALTDPLQSGRGIGEIALGLGFTSDAHFSRAFRRTFGMTPSEARAGACPARPAGRATFINDWMRDLQQILQSTAPDFPGWMGSAN